MLLPSLSGAQEAESRPAESPDQDTDTDTASSPETESATDTADTDAAESEVTETDSQEVSEEPAAAENISQESAGASTEGAVDESPAPDEGLEGDDLDMLDMNLEALLETPIEVWTATKTKSTLAEAPAVMTVVSQEEILHYGYQSVQEVLQQVLGFYIVDDHIIPNLGIRGIAGGLMDESGSIKVMIDGRTVAFRSTGGNWLGPELIPMTAIDRIEIIRGPASALYGADAFLGVVNIITVKGADLSIGRVNSGTNITSNGTVGYDVDAVVGTRLKNFELMLSVRAYEEDRSGLKLPASSPAPGVPAYNADSTEAQNLKLTSLVAHGEMTYHIADKHYISLYGHFGKLTRGGEFSQWSQLSYGMDSDGRQRGTTIALHQSMVGLHVHLAPIEKLSLDWHIGYFYGEPSEADSIDVGSDVYSIERDFGYHALETTLEGRWQILKALTAVLGTEFIYDWENLPSSLRVLRFSIDDLSPGDIMESSSIRQGEEELYNIGAFAQAMWSGWKPYLDLTAGIRYDNHSLYGNQVSGRAGVTSNPVEMLHLKLLYGSAFKAPSAQLLYGVPHQVGDIIGNPDLKPQKVHTVEGQAILKPIKYLSISSGVAYNLILDKAEFVQQGINRVAANLSEVKSLSWESEITAHYGDWVSGSVSFERQWTDRSFEGDRSVYMTYLLGNRNAVYPDYILRVGVTGRFPKIPLRAGARLMYVSTRPSSEMNSLENLSMYHLPSYVLLGATISTVGLKLFGERETAVSVIGRNLTNRKVADPGYAGVDYPLAPLTVFLQIRQEL